MSSADDHTGSKYRRQAKARLQTAVKPNAPPLFDPELNQVLKDLYGDVSIEETPEAPILKVWVETRIWFTEGFGFAWKTAAAGHMKGWKVLSLVLGILLAIAAAGYEYKKLYP